MATDRKLIADVAAPCPKGCRWQLWEEDGAWHIGAACDTCQSELLAVVLEVYPGVAVKHVD